jgi:sigma-B regulation protein RsbU (phosphoserine phosphatase)
VYDENYSLSEIMNKLNRVVYADELLSDIFSTLSLVLLDDQDGTVSYAGAGDLPLLKFDKEKESLQHYQSQGILLGFTDDGSYDEMTIQMEDGEELYLVSDGMMDFEAGGKTRSDIELLKEKLYTLKKNGESLESIKDKLFDKHVSQVDDCSIIIIKKL